MDKRTITAIVLSVAVILIYQTFFVKPPEKQPAAPAATATAQPAAPKIAPEVKAAKAAAPARVAPKPAPVAAPEKTTTVESPLYTAVFTSKGGSLKSLRLKNFMTTTGKPTDVADIFTKGGLDAGVKKPDQVEMVNLLMDMPAPLAVTFPGSSVDVAPDSAYEASTAKVEVKGDGGRLVYTQTIRNAMKIEKIYTFKADKYVIDLEVRLTNLSGVPLNQDTTLAWTQYMDPKAETDSYTHDGPIIYTPKKDVELLVPGELSATEKTFGPGTPWGGLEGKYFIAAMIPQNPSLTSVVATKDSRNMVTVSVKSSKAIIPTGSSTSTAFTLFIGPKDHGILKALNVGLENAIDFGTYMKWLAIPLLVVIQFLYSFIPNYGLAIIILTVLIKIIFWPLGNKSYKSMKDMQKLQPRLQELRDKYKNDKARLSQETMALYKAHQVNPLGGCLPVIIQIPVFFGLYKTLVYAIELRHAPFFGWIVDLSAKDPYYISPILMGATMFIQQKMTPMAGADPTQQKFMLLLPVVFTFMFLSFPSGLVLYWLFNNLLSIGQQHYINKKAD